MNIFEIKNKTNELGKRHPNFNSVVEIDYVDGMVKKKARLYPGKTVSIKALKLPISTHLLKLKGLIEIADKVSPDDEVKVKKMPETKKVEKRVKPKSVIKKKIAETSLSDISKKSEPTKKTVTKKVDDVVDAKEKIEKESGDKKDDNLGDPKEK